MIASRTAVVKALLSVVIVEQKSSMITKNAISKRDFAKKAVKNSENALP